MICRECKETLIRKEEKLIRSKGYICTKCYNLKQKQYADRRAKTKREWRKLYG